MRSYTVHQNPAVDDDDKGLIFIKEGFSWPGLFIPFFWILYHKMWWVTAGWVAVNLVLAGAVNVSGYSQDVMLVFTGALNILMGFEGNNLRRWTLTRRGYGLVAVVMAPDLFQAERRYFADHLPAGRRPQTGAPAGGRAAHAPHGSGEQAVGVFPASGGLV